MFLVPRLCLGTGLSVRLCRRASRLTRGGGGAASASAFPDGVWERGTRNGFIRPWELTLSRCEMARDAFGGGGLRMRLYAGAAAGALEPGDG
jgi:hypothetical protein